MVIFWQFVFETSRMVDEVVTSLGCELVAVAAAEVAAVLADAVLVSADVAYVHVHNDTAAVSFYEKSLLPTLSA